MIMNKRIIGILAIIILSIGLVVTLYLVKQRQTGGAKAELDVSRTFTVTSNQQPVDCQGVTCKTDANTVHVKFNPASTQELLNSLP